MRLLFDFDGTITEKDTIGELGEAAIRFHKAKSGHDLQPTWDSVVQHYIDDFQLYKNGYHIPENSRISLEEELEFQAKQKDLEERSLVRIEQSRVFEGLRTDDLFQMGTEAVESGRVVLRKGFKDVMALVEQRKWDVAIVSVNWSRAFIRGVLHQYELNVIANEISPRGIVQGPDILGETMTNSADKKAALCRLLQDANRETATLYFGDSNTDIECLLKGGVVVSADESSALMKTLRRVGVPVPHVSSAQGDATISWARDFDEVLRSGLLEPASRDRGL
ncbi:hypothetical protein S7711_01241 [Stachybotrys chartarum IBT 7711]|uniref:Uncharacterized protein n=1 Tax=Stachybotrys chartarum (strain CBS 109288 / IBT 7711) TaxID=1280523 RepID=A0A084AT40_STACB|nr:hypothetical protein S7711_01241 [Stachybotrys chartarum IBT 7711]KFA72950.1 hypothetical protein S40288_05066 [Stachybotrys chartarum IBT 40288]